MFIFYKCLIRFKYLQFKELALQKKEEFRSSMSLCAVLATPTFPPACIILKHNVLHAIPVSNSSRKACMQTQACSHCFCRRHRFKLLLFPGYHACFSRKRGVAVKVNILHVLFTPITQAHHHRLNNSDIAGFLQSKSVAHGCLKALIRNTFLSFTDYQAKCAFVF